MQRLDLLLSFDEDGELSFFISNYLFGACDLVVSLVLSTPLSFFTAAPRKKRFDFARRETEKQDFLCVDYLYIHFRFICVERSVSDFEFLYLSEREKREEGEGERERERE